MTNAHPQKKENELIDSINAMVAVGVDHDRLNEILVQARKMQEIGGPYYVPAKRVMGMAAALKGDLAGVDSQFNAAIAHGGRSIEILKDYSVALWNLHQVSRQLELMEELVELSPNDPEIILNAIHSYLTAYNVDGMRRMLKKADQLNLSENELVLKAKSNIDAISSLLNDAGATWEQVSARIELTSNTLNNLGLYCPAMRTEIIDDAVFIEYRLSTDIDNVVRAEDAINNAIANMQFSPADQVTYFSCAQV